MKISFKISDDKLSCEISHDDKFIGHVRLNVFKSTWIHHMTPEKILCVSIKLFLRAHMRMKITEILDLT